MFVIAQLSATPEWTLIVGVLVIAGVFLLGGIYVAVLLVEKFKGEAAEPLHNPGVDKKMSEVVERSEQRTLKQIGIAKGEVKAEVERVEAKVMDLNVQAHGRISKLRDEVKLDLNETKVTLTDGIKEILEISAKMRESVAGLRIENQHQERTIIAQGNKLDRHIERG